MRSIAGCLSLAWLWCTASASLAHGNQPLRLIQSIPLPGVEGRIDHMTADQEGQRLFVAGLANGSVEVIDLRSARRVQSLHGFREPQGVAFVPRPPRLFVANGGDGTCEVFDGNTLQRIRTLHFSEDADNVRYDEASRRIYVGVGEGALRVLDSGTGDSLGDMPLRAHPESFQVETLGPRVFVNLPDAGEVAVMDRTKGGVIGTWSIDGFTANYPMELDEPGHRLFVGCRRPAAVLVFDVRSGRRLATVSIDGDNDDLFYDASTRQLFASCGSGFIDVLRAGMSGQFTRVAKIPTASGARTALYIPKSRRLYLAVPHRGSQRAEIRVYDVAR